MSNVVLGAFSYNNKIRQREIFPNIGKWLTPTNKNKKVTCSNSSLIPHFIPRLASTLEPSRLVRNLSPPQRDKEKP